MSHDSLPIPSWEALRDALAEWRGSVDQNEAFVLRQCDHFDAWRTELLAVEERLQQQTEALETERESIQLQWQRLDELRRGSKESHWMWFVFPQIFGLGHSPRARKYGIANLEEANAYLTHPLLGTRLRECFRLVRRII